MRLKTLLFVLGVTALLFVGCDRSSDLTDAEWPRISPAQVTLSGEQQTVVLEVIGGNPPFTWTVEDEEGNVQIGKLAVIL